MSTTETTDRDQLAELGPVDYIVLEWPGRQPGGGEIASLLLDLVERGIIRILDAAFIAKDEDGTVTVIDAETATGAFGDLAGASSGLMDHSDLDDAAGVIEPGTSAAVLIWENAWAAPVAIAMRRSGGQLVASGRIPVQSIVAALDAAEATS